MTRAEMLAKLRDLLAGERTAAAAVEAEELLAGLEAEKRPRRPVPPAVDEDDEQAKWRRLVSSSPMSRRIWSPSPPSGNTSALRRDSFNPWR